MADSRAYVRARAASAQGAVDAAAAGYAMAMSAAPGDEVVAIRAYRNALAAGDMALARRAAAVLVKSDVAPADVGILQLADALRAGDRAAADDAAGRIGAGPLDFLAPVIRAWLAFERGGDPIATIENGPVSALGRRYIAEHRALLLLASGRMDEGVAALRSVIASNPGSIDLRWNAANLLAGMGERKIALSLLTGDDQVMTGLRGALKRGVKPGAMFGTSRALTRLANDLAGQQTQTLSITLTRAALLLDPADDRARLLLADALADDRAYALAIATLNGVRRDGPFYAAVQTERIEILRRRGDRTGAIALAATIAASSRAGVTDLQRYADLLSDAGRDAEAAKAYARALALAGDRATWVNHLQLGGSLERAGQWEAALPHLRRAVELGPQQAAALNYLGYSWVDRGENLEEARDLLERASRLRPDDAAITDSLGWAWYRLGDYARALPLLEKAAQAEPSSATINEHLGDAYWRVGRRFEARYAWRAATLYADAAQQARIAAKLADGLDTRMAAN